MIDWVNLAANTLWILGLTVALATLSYASWEALQKHEKMLACLGKLKYQIALDAAGILFSAGLAASAEPGWKMAIWIVLAVLFTVQMGAEIFLAQKAKG